MPDYVTEMPVKTNTDGDVCVDISSGQTVGLVAGTAIIGKAKLVDTGGTNELGINASGAIGVSSIGDCSAGTQTHDVKITLDSEAVVLGAGSANVGDVDIASLPAGNLGQQAMAASLSTVPANNISEETYIGDIKFVESIPAGTNNIGDVDITTLPAGNLGQQAMAASLSIVPASDVTDATYIGDIKFGEELPAGTQVIGEVKVTDGTDDLAINADGSINVIVGGEAGTLKTSGQLSSLNLAASGNATLQGAVFITNEVTGKLFRVNISAAGLIKVEIEKIGATTIVGWTAFTTASNPNIEWNSENSSELNQVGNGTSYGFAVKATNLDNEALDVYATIEWLE